MRTAVAGRTFRQTATVFLVVCAVALPFVLSLGMMKALSHDEHQHIAAGALVAREGLLPYRDFPHLHTPYLAFVYALLFRITDHLLLAARLFSVACATAMLGMIGTVAHGLFRERGKWCAAGVCAGAVLLCGTAGVFGITTGRAWNQEPALLFALLAFLAHAEGIARQRNGWFVVSGLLLGLSIGLRITYAPLAAPFGLALLLYLPPPRWQPRVMLCFAAGLFIGTFGILCLFVEAPEQTFFGNFEFARLNVRYRYSSGAPRTVTVLRKVRYLWKEILRRELPLMAACALPMLISRFARTTGDRRRFEGGFVWLAMPFILMGSFAPTPLYPQYFYPLVPFLLLAALYSLASLPLDTAWFRRSLAIGAVIVVISVATGNHAYSHLRDVRSPGEWIPLRVHARGERLRAKVPGGRVLTLAPLYPLEGGLSIYPSFSTGPFAWRLAPFVEPAKAARLGLMTPRTIASILDADAPSGILLNIEPDREIALQLYAESHGYTATSDLDGGELWVPAANSTTRPTAR